ncbi:MAG: hypothetical protein IIA14_12905 [SAR324 cluster bacterium]|nr:hypothetical protein [SAR324 cluster bacterium]
MVAVLWLGTASAFAAELHVMGLPLPFTEGTISSIHQEGDRLVLSLFVEARAYRVEVFPWPLNLPVPVCSGCLLTGEVEASVSGVSHRLELWRDGEPILVIGNNRRRGSHVLPGWRLGGGPLQEIPAGPKGVGPAVAELRLEGSQQRLSLAPGRSLNLESHQRSWEFHLLHAIAPPVEDRLAPRAMEASGPPVALPPRIVHERASLSADWILIPATR